MGVLNFVINFVPGFAASEIMGVLNFVNFAQFPFRSIQHLNKTGQQLANVPSWGSASSRSLLNRLFLKNTLVGPPMSDPLVIL